MNLNKYNWDLTVCNDSFLLCNGVILSTKKDIADLCGCEKSNLCKAVIDLILNKNPNRASELLWEHLSTLKQTSFKQ